jgi:hypothetical protein
MVRRIEEAPQNELREPRPDEADGCLVDEFWDGGYGSGLIAFRDCHETLDKGYDSC